MLDEADSWLLRPGTIARESHVLVQQQFLRLLHVEEGRPRRRRGRRPVIPVFERRGDDLGLCRARRLEAWLHWNEARAAAAAAAWERRPRTRGGRATSTSATRS